MLKNWTTFKYRLELWPPEVSYSKCLNSNIFFTFLKHAVISLPCHVPCGIYLSWYIFIMVYIYHGTYLPRYVNIRILQCVKFFNLSVTWGMVDPMPGTWVHKCKTNDFAPYVKFCIVYTFKSDSSCFTNWAEKILAVISHFFQVGPSNFFQTPLSIFFLFFPNFHFSKRV